MTEPAPTRAIRDFLNALGHHRLALPTNYQRIWYQCFGGDTIYSYRNRRLEIRVLLARSERGFPMAMDRVKGPRGGDIALTLARCGHPEYLAALVAASRLRHADTAV